MIVGYKDRFIGTIETPFKTLDWESDIASVGKFDKLVIPQHRIEYFKYQGRVVWDKKNISQVDPTPHLHNLSTEELIPGEKALLDIVRGTIKPKKHEEIMCRECGRSFISDKNLQKHISTYHKPGMAGRVTKVK